MYRYIYIYIYIWREPLIGDIYRAVCLHTNVFLLLLEEDDAIRDWCPAEWAGIDMRRALLTRLMTALEYQILGSVQANSALGRIRGVLAFVARRSNHRLTPAALP